ncbi:hypothetical protein N6B35_16770 [Klebsiella michiganensis]|uniref:hypothetical protein n=1 Tax=Klebsiella michiganensis TaxID=1134687 RepID=UPI0021D7D710|nr:hypothetical protein [Klebsiella michiganensis]UYB54985.1 hypothetical protein N6B35_16770 [Klebsiella michiganensis]
MADNEKLGSTSPQVLLKNAINLDKLVNDRESESLPDRFDVLRRTWFGMEMVFNRFITYITGRGEQAVGAIGWQELGNWATGLTVDNRQQIVYYNGSWYKYLGELEHVITGDSPENDGGVWSAENPTGKWSNIGDAALRTDLGSSEKGLGGWLVNYTRNKLSSSIKTASQMLDAQPIYCYEFVDVITDKPDISDPTTWDWTPAINAAIAKSKAMQYQPVCLPHHAFITSGGHIPSTNILEYSGGSTTDGKKYKGVPIIGYGAEISKAKFKAAANVSCFSVVGLSGGSKSTCYFRDFTIEPAGTAYQYLGYGIELNSVGYVNISNVAVYFLDENFRFYNGIANGWTEFNILNNCFSYRGNSCYSFIRGAGNDSFHGNHLIGCFGQIRTSGGGGYGLKLRGLSSSALVWLYEADMGIKWYAGTNAKVISLAFAEMTNNTQDMTCEGAAIMESLDDYSRCQHRGRWLNNGTTTFSLVSERVGAQGRFTFQNLHSRTGAFVDSNISDYAPGIMPVTPDIYNNNGVSLFYMFGTNFASPMQTCQNYAGNGFYLGQIPLNGSVKDVTPSWKWSNDGGIMKSYNVAGMRFQIGSAETVRLTSAAIYPFNDNGMTMGLAANRYSNSYVSRRMYTAITGDLFGNGSPEGSVTAGIGSTYRRLDGGASSSFYVKETGTGNTGWIAK